jgi:hypothetical protein
MTGVSNPGYQTDRHPVDLLVWSPVCSVIKYPPFVNFCQQLSRHFYNIIVKIRQGVRRSTRGHKRATPAIYASSQTLHRHQSNSQNQHNHDNLPVTVQHLDPLDDLGVDQGTFLTPARQNVKALAINNVRAEGIAYRFRDIAENPFRIELADFPSTGRALIDGAVSGMLAVFALECDQDVFFLTGTTNPLFVDGELHWILLQQDSTGIELSILESEVLAAVLVGLVCRFTFNGVARCIAWNRKSPQLAGATRGIYISQGQFKFFAGTQRQLALAWFAKAAEKVKVSSARIVRFKLQFNDDTGPRIELPHHRT